MADDATKVANAQDAKRYWLEGGHAAGGVVRQVDYAQECKGADPLFAGIKIVDTDTHFTEPPDLFTARAPAAYKERVPQLRRFEGNDRWFVGDRDFGSIGGNVIAADNNKLLGRLAFRTLEEGHPGSYLLAPRLKAMDDMGVYAQICFQNGGVTQAGSLIALDDDDLAFTILRIFNDASIERQAESGDRIFTLAHLPIWNRAAMEAEARRCIDMGIKGFVLPDMPDRYGIPTYNQPYWAGFLEMCEATGTPLNFHLNSAVDPTKLIWQGYNFERNVAIGSTMMMLGNASTIRHSRHLPQAEDRPDRERRRLGAVHAGSPGAPVPGNHAGREPAAHPEGIFPRQFLGHLLVRDGRAARPAGDHRRRQCDVRDRLPAPDLAVSRGAGPPGGDARQA